MGELLGDVCVFDTEALEWEDSEAIGGIQERCACGAAAVGNMVYVFGGTNGVAVKDDLEVLDTTAQRWLEEKPPKRAPPGRFAHSMTAVGEEVVVFGGITFEEDL